MNIHRVLCWFRVAEHSFVRRKIGFQLQSSSSSSQLPQCCPVVQCASHCSHFSPTLFILLPRTVYWSGRSWFSVCVCVCVMHACFCCTVYFAAQNCVLIWQKLVLCVCDACMFLLHGLFCCPELCTDLAEVGSVCVWCVHVFAARFILLPRTVYWSGRSWFCVMCACFCCMVYSAAQNSVLIWQKLVFCVWCMHVFAALFILLPRTVYWSGRSWYCVCVWCVHVFVVQISCKQVVWSLLKTIMFKSLVSTGLSSNSIDCDYKNPARYRRNCFTVNIW